LANAGITFIEGSNNEEFLSYKQLYECALNGLGYLQDMGLRPKDEVVFQVEENKSFIIIFWACILGGIIPVPVAIGNNDEHRRKLFNIWKLLKNPHLIGSERGLAKIREFAANHDFISEVEGINKKFILKDNLEGFKACGQVYDTNKEDIAFIQFSSGSTGTPKGVILTHENLITNVKAIGNMAKYSSNDAMLSWMPLTHDMGLIGFHLCPIFEGMNHWIMSTALFVRRPSLWLEKASKHRASILCSPNFGYKYVLKHTNEQDKRKLDLSGIRLFYNGAEPISAELCQDFLSYFESCGLKSNAICPVYGLAEASLAVSISNLEDEIISIQADRHCLQVGDVISESTREESAVSLVNVGKPVLECAIRITDEDNTMVDDGVIGHVQIKGKNVTAGYYNIQTSVLSKDGWLDTGDLGLLKNGALYITGRAKDIIFANGQNYYPHDIEQVAQNLKEIDLNRIAVVGYFNHESQENETIAFVLHRGDLSRFMSLANDLKAIISSQVGLDLNKVLPTRDIPRTTSGKLQRYKLIERYSSGHFTKVEANLNELMIKSGLKSKSALAPIGEIEKRLLIFGLKYWELTIYHLHKSFWKLVEIP